MLFLLENWKWLLGAAASVILGIWLGVTKIELADLKTANATAIATATEAARLKDSENQHIASEVEIAHAHAAKLSDDLADVNRRLALALGMHDRPRPHLPSPATNTCNSSDATTGSQLSDELTQFLLAEFKRADDAANYATECHDWAIKVGGR